jgi:hypothetical protein
MLLHISSTEFCFDAVSYAFVAAGVCQYCVVVGGVGVSWDDLPDSVEDLGRCPCWGWCVMEWKLCCRMSLLTVYLDWRS